MASTARKLAEHRAKLCLLGLKELQKSWDLENWVLDLFFRCLDDRTARNLRLADVGMPPSGISGQLSKGPQTPASPTPDVSSNGSGPLSPHGNENVVSMAQVNPLNPPDDASINMDWYELFNVEGEDFSGLAGSLTNPDYLNPQNLEFLYRFL